MRLVNASGSSRIWVYFIAGGDELGPMHLAAGQNGHLNKYDIREVVQVRGGLPANLARAQRMVRLETPTPIVLTKELPSPVFLSGIVFCGVTQHLQYTTDAQRRELDARSRSELPPSSQTVAVLIPIRKSNEWWELAQDKRQSHFQRATGREGHTAIGLKYVDRIYRKLYHSRYSEPASSYDFLTYFEFHDANAENFRALLEELRNTTRNPEWTYVTHEFEIWMTKTSW